MCSQLALFLFSSNCWVLVWLCFLSCSSSKVCLCTSSIPEAGFGICTRTHITAGTWMGPFEGHTWLPEEFPPGRTTEYMWEVRSVLPSARICPYFYGNSTCNPQYGNAVVDSANLKKSKPISKCFNLKQVSVSNWPLTMPGDRSVNQLAADQHLATRYYLNFDTTLVAWHALSEVRVQFGGLCLVFNDHVWATKFPTAQEEEGEKSWSFFCRGVYRREFRLQKKRPAFCLLLSLLRGLHHWPWLLQRHNPTSKMHLWVFELFELCFSILNQALLVPSFSSSHHHLLRHHVYYRKRGSVSYIVREVHSVRERERERDTERERRKWRHHCSAKIGDEFCTSPCQKCAP